jgi:cytochrome c oxidase assembly factor CtaG
MKKNIIENLRSLVALYATSLDTKALQQKSITLEELVDEVMPLLSRSAPNIIEEIPVFTDWVESNLSAPLKRQKKNSWKWYKPSSRYQYYEERK